MTDLERLAALNVEIGDVGSHLASLVKERGKLRHRIRMLAWHAANPGHRQKAAAAMRAATGQPVMPVLTGPQRLHYRKLRERNDMPHDAAVQESLRIT